MQGPNKGASFFASKFRVALVLILVAFFFNNVFGLISYGSLEIGAMGEINKFLVGLAFFLIGIDIMSDGMQRWAGDSLRIILAKVTDNRFIGMLAGASVTVIIQSSSATVGILIGFVKAGLMTFTQTLGPILGADIGTTVTAWIVAFKFTKIAGALFLTGFFISQIFGKRDRIASFGYALAGFGLLFLGLNFMSEVVGPLKQSLIFQEYASSLENPLVGIIVGALFTAVINSSSATSAIVVGLASSGLITLEAGIPLILGANIGTCITAVYVSIGAGRDAKRVALAHSLFKVCGVLMFVFWIPQFAEIVRWLCVPLGSSVVFQIAMAHTLFNVAMALIFLPFILPVNWIPWSKKVNFANIIYRLFPKRALPFNLTPWEFTDSILETPDFAIAEARKRMYDMVSMNKHMLDMATFPFVYDPDYIDAVGKKFGWSQEKISEKIQRATHDGQNPSWTIEEGIVRREEATDKLKEELERFLKRLRTQQGLTDSQIDEIDSMILVVNKLENIADIIHDDMLELLEKKKLLPSDFTDEGREELSEYYKSISEQLNHLGQFFRGSFSEDGKVAKFQIKKNDKLYLRLCRKHRERYCNRPAAQVTDEIHEKFLEYLNRINGHIGDAAKYCEKYLISKE